MDAKHTPGPWIVRESPKPNIEGPELRLSIKHTSPGRDGAEFCEIVAGHVTAEADATARANARLIAAAPDLLAACEAAYQLGMGERDDGHAVKTMLCAALAKARGEA